ncbi:MAG: tRNA 4-thiouridine(8) synthase ThiI, partial [Clostridia bacterium]|nr:tRNA 4-thiouridine(8) synthase ThiI [Clostridia bacterium]
MKEILLCKYGEIVLKGGNRRYFEDTLVKEMRYRAANFGNFQITNVQSTMTIEPADDFADLDGMFDAARRLFGIAAVGRAAVAEKNMDSILEIAKAYLPAFLEGKKTFKVEAKRSDKTFPLSSPEISATVGGAILSVCPRLRVDVHNPDITLRVEVRDRAAYVHAGQFKGAGGLPVGTNGKGLLLLSGGIDSPVAGWMMAKRGVRLEAVYFESMPYTSEQARQKVLDLAALVARWSGSIMVHVISLTHIQEELVRNCEEEYFTLLLRRYMMQLANMVAKKQDCQALITGESLGQVASQTMHALNVTNALAEYPVFRPVIGMDKEEI